MDEDDLPKLDIIRKANVRRSIGRARKIWFSVEESAKKTATMTNVIKKRIITNEQEN